jgi:hypothetical protein
MVLGGKLHLDHAKHATFNVQHARSLPKHVRLVLLAATSLKIKLVMLVSHFGAEI